MTTEREIRDMMFRVETARKRRLHPVWADMGLTAGQPRVLNQLLNQDHITQKELSDFCDMEPTTLSRVLDKVETMGYVNRMNNPGCRRSFLIALTEEGREKAMQVRKVFADIEIQMMEGFSDKEMELLKGMMSRIHENLN